jgi:[ribosomal protein S5]-alanine N-acetyltransferase
MQILTKRLRLIPATVASMKAEIANAKQLSKLLDLSLPKSWPPPLNDRDSQRWMLSYLQAHESSRWGMWYIVLRKRRQLIGNCGFKGEPVKGAVEIGYSIAPEYHRRGYATEAVRGLLQFAFTDPQVRRVLGETLPELTPSIGVLKKCGFRRVPGGSEPGVIRFSIPRTRYESQ